MKKNIYLVLGIGILLVLTIAFVSSYVPPTYNSVNFTLVDDYVPPTYNSVNFTLEDTETTSCVVYITDSNSWYVPANCTCYKETSATQMYLNLNDWSCFNG